MSKTRRGVPAARIGLFLIAWAWAWMGGPAGPGHAGAGPSVRREKVGPPKPAAADTSAGDSSAAADSAAAEREITDLGGGRYRIGAALIDTQARSIQVPGRVNMDRGMVELLACTPLGKVHESVLSLDVEPYHLQVALLLLGLKRDESGDVVHRGPGVPTGPGTPGAAAVEGGGDTKEARDAAERSADARGGGPGSASAARGDSVVVWVEWKDAAGATRGVRAESLLWNVVEKKTMPETWWAFTGSRIVRGFFAAQREGGLIATYFDSYSILNNPLPTRDNDKLYAVNLSLVPPKGTPVTVTLYDAKAWPPGK